MEDIEIKQEGGEVTLDYVFAQKIDETNHPLPTVENQNKLDLTMEIQIENEDSKYNNVMLINSMNQPEEETRPTIHMATNEVNASSPTDTTLISCSHCTLKFAQPHIFKQHELYCQKLNSVQTSEKPKVMFHEEKATIKTVTPSSTKKRKKSDQKQQKIKVFKKKSALTTVTPSSTSLKAIPEVFHANMNHVDYLLKHRFLQHSLENQLKIKALGPHQPMNFVLTRQGEKYFRKFNTVWYDRKLWLTVSEKKNALFCFYCLLFQDPQNPCSVWAFKGTKDVCHLGALIAKHEASASHLQNALTYTMFGSVNIIPSTSTVLPVTLIKQHNEGVQRRRYILNKIVDGLKFCGRNELPIRGHDEPVTVMKDRVFLEYLEEIAKMDVVLDSHLKSPVELRYTSEAVKNDLLDCVHDVFTEAILNDLKCANYAAVHSYDMADIEGKSQCVLTLRYIKDYLPCEKFYKFIERLDRSDSELAKLIVENLKVFNLHSKLIAQACNRSASESENGSKNIIKEEYKYAHPVHSYTQSSCFVVKQICASIKDVRIFFTNLSAFSSYFRQTLDYSDLNEETDSHMVATLLSDREKLIQRFSGDGWTDTALIGLLYNEHFMSFTVFFNEIFNAIDMFFNFFKKCRHDLEQHAENHVNIFQANMKKVKNKVYAENDRPTFERIVDLLTSILTSRFLEERHIRCFKIINVRKFKEHRARFPELSIKKFYTMYDFLDEQKLNNELKILYTSKKFENFATLLQLYRFLVENQLLLIMTETVKAIEIVLTAPVLSKDDDRCFDTVKRVQSFLNSDNSCESRLSALGVLSMEKDYIANIQNFNYKVIDKFSRMTERQAMLTFK